METQNCDDLTVEEQKRLLIQDWEDEGTDKFFLGCADLAQTTVRTYRASWNDFASWCRSEGKQMLPASPETIGSYLESRRHLALSTLRNRLSTLSFVHRYFELGDSTGEGAAAEARREIAYEKRREESDDSSGSMATGQHPPSVVVRGGLDLLKDYFGQLAEKDTDEKSDAYLSSWKKKRQDIREVWTDTLIPDIRASASRMTPGQKELIPDVGPGLSEMRDRAVLLLMSTSDISRAEAARMDFADLVPRDDHLVAGIRKSNGRPARKVRLFENDSLHLCPLRAMVAWSVGAGLEGGPLFRAFDAHGNLKSSRIGTSSINLLLKKAAEASGLSPDEWSPSQLSETPMD